MEAANLPAFSFWTLRRDAWIYTKAQMPDGGEYLTNAWYDEQTEPDYSQIERKEVS